MNRTQVDTEGRLPRPVTRHIQSKGLPQKQGPLGDVCTYVGRGYVGRGYALHEMH